MTPVLPGSDWRCTLIARNGPLLLDMRPYVASINRHGVVAFQAALSGGRSGVFAGDGATPLRCVAQTTVAGVRHFCSHPDIDAGGVLSVYAEMASGAQAVVSCGPDVRGEPRVLAQAGEGFCGIGPLGPTMNDAAQVAFRAERRRGVSGIFVGGPGTLAVVAESGERFESFEGLPVISARGAVALRANGRGAAQQLCLWRDGDLQVLAETGAAFSALSAFCSIDDAHGVAFAASLHDGGTGIFRVSGDDTTTLVPPDGRFESIRGALLDGRGGVVFAATPRGGCLGIYASRPAALPRVEHLLSAGEPLLGSAVDSFALNPVSVNEAGQVAIRVLLQDGAQAILRVEANA